MQSEDDDITTPPAPPPRARAEIQRVVHNVVPFRFLALKDYLAEVYSHLKAHFSPYSYNEYSFDTGFGRCNAMHLIVKGVRPLTLKGLQKIVKAFGLVGSERLYVLSLLKYVDASDAGEKQKAFAKLMKLKAESLPTDLDRKQLKFYEHWYHPAILELLRVADISMAPEWIASRLVPRIPPYKVVDGLKLLGELGYVIYDPKLCRLVPSQEVFTTGPEVLGMGVTSYHESMLELARDAIGTMEPNERDISSLTLALSESLRTQLKEEIIAFRRRIIDLVEAEDRRRDHAKEPENRAEVVQLNIQLFPLARKLVDVE